MGHAIPASCRERMLVLANTVTWRERERERERDGIGSWVRTEYGYIYPTTIWWNVPQCTLLTRFRTLHCVQWYVCVCVYMCVALYSRTWSTWDYHIDKYECKRCSLSLSLTLPPSLSWRIFTMHCSALGWCWQHLEMRRLLYHSPWWSSTRGPGECEHSRTLEPPGGTENGNRKRDGNMRRKKIIKIASL